MKISNTETEAHKFSTLYLENICNYVKGFKCEKMRKGNYCILIGDKLSPSLLDDNIHFKTFSKIILF